MNKNVDMKHQLEELKQKEYERAQTDVIRLMEKHKTIVNKELKYLKNIPITEYDMEDAGFTIIKNKKLLPDDTIRYLETLTKHQRNIKIGKLQRDRNNKDLSTKMNEEFIRVRQEFARQNNLFREDILSIKKDAIFVIRKNVYNTLIDGVYNFRPKEVFSSYFYIRNKEILLQNGDLVLKGFMEPVKKNKDTNLLNEIRKIMSMAEKVSRKELYNYLSMFRKRYLMRSLPVDCYKDLDSGLFHISGYRMEDIPRDLKKELDITGNYINYIVPLIKELLK